jgi:hypothetical protein
MNEVETKRKQRINETKSWFLDRINKIDKVFGNQTKETQINKVRDERGDITINTNEIRRIIRKHLENLDSNKLENVEEMDSFLDAYDLPKLHQEDTNHLNKSIISNEIETVIKNLPPKKTSGLDGFTAEFYQIFKDLTQMLLKLVHKI